MLSINNILKSNVIGSIFVAIFLLIMGGGLTSCGFGGGEPAGENNRGVSQPRQQNENEEDDDNQNRNQNEGNEEDEDDDDDDD